MSYELGLSIGKGPLQSKIAIYHTVIKNMITLKPTLDTEEGNTLTEKRNAGRGYAQGLELDMQYSYNNKLSFRLFHNQMGSAIESYPDTSDTIKTSPLSRMLPTTTRFITNYHAPMAKITLALTHAASQNKLSFGIENIGDVGYRIHGSGQNELGRNFIASIDAKI